MTDSLKNSLHRLAMQSNILNDQANGLLLAAKLIQEYRTINQNLLAFAQLTIDTNATQDSHTDGAAVSSQIPSAAQKDLR